MHMAGRNQIMFQSVDTMVVFLMLLNKFLKEIAVLPTLSEIICGLSLLVR